MRSFSGIPSMDVATFLRNAADQIEKEGLPVEMYEIIATQKEGMDLRYMGRILILMQGTADVPLAMLEDIDRLNKQ